MAYPQVLQNRLSADFLLSYQTSNFFCKIDVVSFFLKNELAQKRVINLRSIFSRSRFEGAVFGVFGLRFSGGCLLK
jgi:hypothetical protein